MLKFIHLANLHCEAKGKRNKRIRERLGFIAEKYPGHYLIITGDLVDDGLESQYKALKRMLPVRAICAPGNHDYKLIGNFYRRHSAKLYDKYFGKGRFAGKNKPIVTYLGDDTTKVMLIALDSNIESRNPLKFARGKIGLFQRRALKKLLKQSPDDLIKIVYFHHHLLWNNSLLCLIDREKLMALLYEKVDIILFGHKHKPKMWTDAKHKPYYILAADNMPDAETAEEITIDGKNISVQTIPII